MNIRKIAARFFVPAPLVSIYYLLKFGAKVSPRAEVELSPNLEIGRDTQIGSFSKIKAADGPFHIGARVSIGTGCFLSSHAGGVYIGADCLIGPNVSIIGNNYRYDRLDLPVGQQEKTSRGIRIGSDVWLGAGVVVADGVEIGEQTIVTPGAVVTGRLPPRTVASGVPAKVIFKRR